MILSILDQSPISEGSTGADALRNTLDLARLADQLGFARYWVAEHHGTPMLACASPEVMIASIGSITRRIRIGSGGVMLPHYSSLKVAETFSILSALFPDRVDLGIGRAPGTDRATAFALQRDRRQPAPDDFPQQLGELLGYLENRMPQGHPFARLAALPGRPYVPEVWLLGSSAQSALWAADSGLPYVFADFINPDGATYAAIYRDRFCASETLAEPRVIVAGWAICAETDAEAQRIASSARMTRTLLNEGQLIPVPPIDKALRFLAERGPSPDTVARPRRAIIGDPETVKRGIEELAALYGAEEAMIVTITYDHAARRRSYELIAEAFGLG
ncbi:MAG: LLM class flavin-dependent oxidoreductase [Bryobacteraceae bacterium]|jgi:luciferase family oxidoreductase group 1